MTARNVQPLSRFDYATAFARNRGLIDADGQRRLRDATVAIPGMGGVGGVHLATLARLGVGGFRIADPDTFELANRNRQYGALDSTVGHPKAGVMADIARDINPELRLEVRENAVTPEAMPEFLKGCDLAIDGLDAFALDARLALFREARRLRIPVITAGPIGYSAAMLVMTADSMDLDTYLAIEDGMTAEQRFVRFIIGLTPTPAYLRYIDRGNVDVADHRGPSVASAVTLCAGFAATEAVKLLTGRGRVHALPGYHYYDPFLGLFRQGRVPFGNRNPLQWLKYRYACRKLGVTP